MRAAGGKDKPVCFLMSITRDSLFNRWGELLAETEVPDYYCASGFEHPLWPVVCSDNPERIDLLSWGLIPFWVKDPDQAGAIRRNTLNARSETLYQKPSFRGSVAGHRCLVLIDGFFEPHKHEGRSFPFYCHMRDNSAFAVAGIFSYWKNPADGATAKTFSLITTAANELMSAVHNEKKRMPAILDKEEESMWLDTTIGRESVESLLATKEISELTAHPVSRSASTRSPDTFNPDTQKPVDYPQLAHLKIE